MAPVRALATLAAISAAQSLAGYRSRSHLSTELLSLHDIQNHAAPSAPPHHTRSLSSLTNAVPCNAAASTSLPQHPANTADVAPTPFNVFNVYHKLTQHLSSFTSSIPFFLPSLSTLPASILPSVTAQAGSTSPTSSKFHFTFFLNLMAPMLYLSKGQEPDADSAHEALLEASSSPQALFPWQLSTLLWSRAYLNSISTENSINQLKELQPLVNFAQSNLVNFSLYDAIIITWSLFILGIAPQGIFDQLAASYRAAELQQQLEEPAVVYMLQCCLWHLSQTSSASSSGQLAPSKQQLDALLRQHKLKQSTRQRLLAAYSDFVPFHPAMEGPYMVSLHLIKMLPLLASSTGSTAASSLHISAAEASSAAELLQQPRELARLRREMFHHHRHDVLIDSEQRALNELQYLLQRRLNLEVQLLPDSSLVLPREGVVVLLVDDVDVDKGAPDRDGALADRAASRELHALLRNPLNPRQGFAKGRLPGMVAARSRMLQQQGWGILRVDLKGFTRLGSVDEKEKYLRAALQAV